MSLTSLVRELEGIAPVRQDEPMSRHTSFHLGGPADLFVTIADPDQMGHAIRLARLHHVPYLILGGGSNLLVADAGIRGLVIQNRMRRIEPPRQLPDTDTLLLRAQSGTPLARLARRCVRLGLEGLEWAAGIPGTVGGAVVFNAGAFSHQIGEVLRGVEVLAEDGLPYLLPTQELGLGYRESAFSRGPRQKRAPILATEFLLRRQEPSVLQERLAQFNRQRRASQPRGRSGGSVFKNPPDDFAGRLIEAAGLKGQRLGGAQISAKHANFIINRGGATAAEVAALIQLIRERVQKEFGITLEPEIEAIGDWSQNGGLPWQS